jgi:predicted RNase H-like HicB family nuclease
MTIQAVVHKAEEDGYWAEVPSIPGCATQGETVDELMANLRETITGCLSVAVDEPLADPDGQVLEIAPSA